MSIGEVIRDPEDFIERAIAAVHNATEAGHLIIWTVYDHPKDIPDSFVVRGHEIGRSGQDGVHFTCFAAPTLDKVRAVLPPGLVPMLRSPEDDASIVETWL